MLFVIRGLIWIYGPQIDVHALISIALSRFHWGLQLYNAFTVITALPVREISYGYDKLSMSFWLVRYPFH